MPGLSKRLSKPDAASADQKRKKNNQKQQRVLKRIRVIYSDPDATDSSSDDEQRCDPHGVKRRVKVIEMFESVLHAKKTSKAPSQNVLNRKGMGSTSKYVGVRQRKTGRWVAEIKDPFRDVRHWLGTFNTEEEAHRAYEKKRQEFEAEKGVKAPIATHRSPTSVLDAPNATSHCSDPNVNRDCNEREVETKAGETQGLDGNSGFEGGLKFVFDELKEEDFLMCNLGDLADLENVGGLLDLDMEDFSWLDEVLKYSGFEN